MASEQARRENVVKQREVKVEKDKGRDSGVHVTHAATERGRHGGGEAAAVFGQEGPGRVGVELTGEGREELESGAHGFHGEKARHAQILAAGGEEIRERKGQVSIRGGGGGRSAADTVTEKGRQAKESVGKGAQRASDYVTEKARETGHVAAQKRQEAKEQADRGKDTAAEKARRASE
ncbi:unnamed protein product [Brassica rapa]|uniref:Uncharacterized protein n=1 Tax=Brassica campestris TaxID=3711 RepID=A0A3P6A7Z9_BRACM|nr:unnamed protein product [Brassica rapa]VDC80368.1 unnamed protein product [Brassica rapa]